METAVIVLVDGGGGGGAVFALATALPPVVEQTEREEEREEDERHRENEVALRAAHLLTREVTFTLGLSLATELLGLGGVEDVRGVGALTAVLVAGANHPLPPDPSYPLSSSPRPG